MDGGPSEAVEATFARDAVSFRPPLWAAVLGASHSLRELALHSVAAIAALLHAGVYPQGYRMYAGDMRNCRTEQNLLLYYTAQRALTTMLKKG